MARHPQIVQHDSTMGFGLIQEFNQRGLSAAGASSILAGPDRPKSSVDVKVGPKKKDTKKLQGKAPRTEKSLIQQFRPPARPKAPALSIHPSQRL